MEDFKNVVSLAQSLKIKGLSDEENVIEGFEACAWSEMLQSKKKRIVKMPSKGRGALRNKKLLMGGKKISTCDTVPLEVIVAKNVFQITFPYGLLIFNSLLINQNFYKCLSCTLCKECNFVQ